MKTLSVLKSALSSGLALLLAYTCSSASPTDMPQIGVAGAVKGVVKAFPPSDEPVGRNLASGQPLYLNEKIATGPQGSLQVMLLDETVFTIGPNSSMTLDEFIYDPKSRSGKVTARVTNGVFRFVTGQIGHKKPSDMTVKFPAGTLGIRGTIVAGRVTETDTTVVLLGPGPATNAAEERVGAFRMENAGVQVDVVKPGYGTHVDDLNAPPSRPALVPQAQLSAILQAISHKPQARVPAAAAAPPGTSNEAAPETAAAGSIDEQQPGLATSDLGANPAYDASAGDAPGPADDSGSATDASGQSTAQAGGDLSTTQDIADLGADLGNAALNAVNDIGDTDLASLIANNQASWDDVRSITEGTGYYAGSANFNLTQCNGGACAGPTGTVSLYLDVDFGKMTIGSAASRVTVSANDAALAGPINDAVNFDAQCYAGQSGLATLLGASGAGTTATLSLLNVGGIAGVAAAAAKYNAGGTIGSGSVVAPLICTSGACH